jgi:predicted DNA-binding transcriptional regulator AlpA
MPHLTIHGDARAGPLSDPPAVAAESLLLTARQAAALCGVSLATWHRMASAGRCPAPLRLSAGCVRWRRDDLEGWVFAGCPSRTAWEAMRGAARANGRPAGAGR